MGSEGVANARGQFEYTAFIEDLDFLRRTIDAWQLIRPLESNFT
jgi:hypothetical protein